MSHEAPGNQLSAFMQQAQGIIQQHHGINDQTLTTLANLAAQTGISTEEMQAAGMQLGLANSEIQQVVSEGQLESERGNSGSAARWVVIAGSFAVVLGVVGGVLFFLWSQKQKAGKGQAQQQVAKHDNKKGPENDGGDKDNTKNNGDGNQGKGGPGGNDSPNNGKKNQPQNGGNGGETPQPIPKHLQDPELMSAVARLQRQLPPRDQALFEKLKLVDAAKRREAWNQLLPRLHDFLPYKQHFKQLLVSYFAKEDSPPNAQLIRDAVLELLPPAAPVFPKGPGTYERAFWAAEIGVESIHHASAPPPRKQQLQQALEKALQIKLPPGQSLPEAKKSAGKALAEMYFNELIAKAKKTPDQAATLQTGLTQLTLSYLEFNRQSELLAKLKAEINEAKTPENPNPPPSPKNPRLTKLLNTADVLLRKTQPSADDPLSMLQDSVNFAFAATLACALVHEKEAEFDRIAGNPPNLDAYKAKMQAQQTKTEPNSQNPLLRPALADGAKFGVSGGYVAVHSGVSPLVQFPGQPANPGSTQPLDWTKTDRLALALRKLKHKYPQVRFQGIQYIALNLQDADLHVRHAEAVAAYLLSIKNKQEYDGVIAMAPRLGRFRSLYLAMADYVDAAVLSAPLIETFLSAMTGQQLSFGRGENWRKKCKAFLLQKTLEMNQAPVDGDAYQLVFRDLYNKQADLSGSPAPSGAAKATDLLEQLLQTKGQKLAALPVKNISAAAEKYVSDIPHRLTAIGYLAQNDLQKMVLLLRMHMKLLAVEVALAHANKAEFAENLCLELDSKCREQPNAVAQMWYCDHYLLRLWVLHLDDSMQIVKKSE